MATTTYCEIEAFLWKYCQLTSFGVNTNINFSSVNGNVFVSFAAELGSIISPTSTPRSSPNSSKRSHQKPSRIKRRRQRTEVRSRADKIIADVSTSPTTSPPPTDESAQVAVDSATILDSIQIDDDS